MTWDQQIKDSDVFVVIGTKYYFESARCYAQAMIAKELGKPFRILLKRGTEIPEDFLEGVEDVQIEEYDSKGQLLMAASKLLDLKDL